MVSMFALCCAEATARSSRKVSSADGILEGDESEAIVEADESRATITQFPALPDSIVKDVKAAPICEDKEFLPDTIPAKGVIEEKHHSLSTAITEGNPGLEEGLKATKIGRRTRLEGRAADSHWKLQTRDLRMEKELSRTLKSTLHLARWKGTEVVVKCVQVPDEPTPQRNARRPSNSSTVSFSKQPSITASRPMQMHDVNEDLLEELLHEIELLSSLRHPDLVLFLGACLDKDSPVMCVTEYMPGGDLERYYIAKRKQNQTDRWRPPLSQIVSWCSAVARGLSFLHTRDNEPIVHRDLKPLNLLLTKHLEVKIADLGISKMMAAISFGEAYKMTGGVGSWLYMAPEVVRHQSYNEKADIYAFSLIMFFMSAGKAPFYQLGKDPELVLKEYLKGKEPRPTEADCHLKLQPIMKSAWAVDQRERPSAQTLVERFRDVQEDAVPLSCLCGKA